MRNYLLALVAILFIASGCKPKQTIKDKQKEIETGKLSNQGEYKADEVGWTATIPAGWDVITGAEQAKLMDKGAKDLKDATNVQIDASGMKQLLNLKKDVFNAFLSSIEPFPEDAGVSFEETDKQLSDLVRQTYRSKGIPANYDRSIENIDGLDFYLNSITIYDRDSSKVIMNQKMYSRIINGYIFSMTLNYNNKSDFEAQDQMIKTSKFLIRK